MKQREIGIDVMKALLVLGMVYCHILQFFMDLGKQPLADHVTQYINVVTFSGFVFVFGYTGYMTYLSKSFKAIYMKLGINTMKMLFAFYLSGTAFRVLVDHRKLTAGVIRNIVLLKDIPGWSEFIISFALFLLLTLIFYYPLKKGVEYRIPYLVVTALLLLTTFIPYEHVPTKQLGLIVGSTLFASFPVVQYLPFFLIGIYFKRYGVRASLRTLLGGAALSSIGLVYMGMHAWQIPGRFPPTIYFLLLAAFPLMIYHAIGQLVEEKDWHWHGFALLGGNTMVYLLLSNMMIFALAGARAFIRFDWTSTLLVYVGIMGTITYLVKMCHPGHKTINGRQSMNPHGQSQESWWGRDV